MTYRLATIGLHPWQTTTDDGQTGKRQPGFGISGLQSL